MKIVVLTAMAIVVTVTMNYGLALAGEPRALWIMHDVLGWL